MMTMQGQGNGLGGGGEALDGDSGVGEWKTDGALDELLRHTKNINNKYVNIDRGLGAITM